MFTLVLLACTSSPTETGSTAETGGETGGETGEETGGETAEETGGDTDTAPERLTFTNTLFPVWAEACGGCHAGWGSLGDPEALLANMLTNGHDGPPLVAGDRAASAVYTKIAADDTGRDKERMPLQLTVLSDEEVAEFGAWIDAGAANDSTWSGLFRITWEQRKCGMCHQAWGGFSPDAVHEFITTESVYSGALVTPGSAADSLVYQQMASTTADEDRMPQRFDYVDDATVERIGQWIDEGAVFE